FTPEQSIPYTIRIEDAEDGDSVQYDELMSARAFVSARWNRGQGKEETSHPGLALMKQSDCFNCHGTETKIVGPAYLDVASKYGGQAGALEATIQRVIKGSSGVWGTTPMLPHESLSKDQVRLMVQWVFELKPGVAGASVVQGLAGKILSPAGPVTGQVVLEANYTDAGRAPAGSLAGSSRVTLRGRRIEAEQANAMNGPRIEANDKASGGRILTQLASTHTVKFDNLNLSDSVSVSCRVANGGEDAAVEFHEGSAKGELLSTIPVKPTGGWNQWAELTSPLKTTTKGPNAVCLTFTGFSTNRLMNLDWVQFNAR
ncbi:MAG TPA: carbohydrate-binding protein, partial [Candidatus Eisenbacteria bacterium]|nr:carbohydrate-binding protein [Candidatus Eisenbacteria bacterium]